MVRVGRKKNTPPMQISNCIIEIDTKMLAFFASGFYSISLTRAAVQKNHKKGKHAYVLKCKNITKSKTKNLDAFLSPASFVEFGLHSACHPCKFLAVVVL